MRSFSTEDFRRWRSAVLSRLGLQPGRWLRGRVHVERGSHFLSPLTPRSWRYGLYCPRALRDDSAAPLLVVLHGCHQRPLAFARASGWTRFADSAGVRLLCPGQRRLANRWCCWNWFDPLAQRGGGELRAVLQMIDDCAARVRIDERAIAAVGLSAGGAMAALLAFHHAGRVRAAIAVAAPPLVGEFGALHAREVMQQGLRMAPELALGALQTACTPLAVLHGTADDTVNPRCAEQLVAQALASCRRAGLPVATADAGADAGVPPSADGVAVADHRVGGALRVRRVMIDGLGHAWSGGPGGHSHCLAGGPPLVALCERFLREVGLFEAPIEAAAVASA